MTEQLKQFLRDRPYLSLSRIGVDLWGKGARVALHDYLRTGYMSSQRENELAEAMKHYGFKPNKP
jgi:hypothetical protein